MRAWLLGALLLAGVSLQSDLRGGAVVSYRFSFPEPQHHWMQVEAVFTELDSAPLQLRMSRSSPGRYSLHEFAKNVYDMQAFGPDGAALTLERPDASGWTVVQHGPSVSLRYRVFGDRVDGTYLGIDPTHAHMNMPAVVLWARGLEDRPVRLTLDPPAGTRWAAATQLFPGTRAFEFTAPNLQYLMDSPTELGPIVTREFRKDGRTFRFALHHTGTAAELDAFMPDVQRIVSAERDVFGEFPAYDQGVYTFIADYLPYASSDGMEHRNSTVMTASSTLANNRSALLGTVAHEFFHGWNVERIRPQSLEPFDLERANQSPDLWLAEGFTQYYGPLAMSRAGVADIRQTVSQLGDLVRSVVLGPGRAVRSAEDMSRMAVFTDGGRTVDRTNWSNTFISYYPYGGAVALALDLTLRERFEGRVSLDDFMRAMWRVHGKPPAPRPGFVAHPYTSADAEQRLAEVTGDPDFARDFFKRHIRGREVVDYARLLAQAGLVLRRQRPGSAWWGDLDLQTGDGLRVAQVPLANTPIYAAGIDVGDEVRKVDGQRVTLPDHVQSALRRHKPGDAVSVEYVDRTGVPKTATVVLAEDPNLELLPTEWAGGTLTASQKAFRQAWLGSKG
ncbi:MAG: M61 family metallopeptidase [Vicinamibacterales bacterium]